MYLEPECIYTYPCPEGHTVACRCEECHKHVEGRRYLCAYCKQYFPWEAIKHILGDHGYTKLCATCLGLPETNAFLPSWKRMSLGLVSQDEIANWNAFHDM